MVNFNDITDVESLCKLYSGKKVYVYILGGNRGDGAIYNGGRTLFKKYNIDFMDIWNINYITEPENATLFVYGCGGYCSFFSAAVKFLQGIERMKEVFILPSTFDCTVETISNFIANLCDNVMVFCRETTSYNHVIKYIKCKNNVRVDHDLSFHADYSGYLKNCDINRYNLLIALRKDRESERNWSIKHLSDDISDGHYNEYEYFISIINKYKTIITDRAHVAIIGCILGKEVYMLPDGYHKLKSIYEYSLKSKYNVYFYCDNNEGFVLCESCDKIGVKNNNKFYNCKHLIDIK